MSDREDMDILKEAGEMLLQMSATLHNPMSEEQAKEYLQELRAVGDIAVWRRPKTSHDGRIYYHEFFLKCWPNKAALAAKVLATIADNHPANRELYGRSIKDTG